MPAIGRTDWKWWSRQGKIATVKYTLAICLWGCGSSPAPTEKPVQPAPADAAVDATPDAGVSEAVTNAPAWVFRYNAPGRLETWTLRYAGDQAMVVVESARGTTRYIGSAADGGALTLTLAAGPNKLSLECKRQQLAVGAECGKQTGDKTTKKLDVLDCYHPDFKSPMSFAAAPGVEFVTSDACTGYRVLAP
jgi:hypothetical protein